MTFLPLLFIFQALSLLTAPLAAAAQHYNVVDYWKSLYPTTPIPSIVSQHISQMGDHEVNTLISLIHKDSLSSHLPLFCETADLVCSLDETNMLASKIAICLIKYMKAQTRNITFPGFFFRESALKSGSIFNMGKLQQYTSFAKVFLPNSISSLLPLEQSKQLFKDTNISHFVSHSVDMCRSDKPEEMMKCVSSVEELLKFPEEVFKDRRLKMIHSKSDAGSHQSVLLQNIRPLLQEKPDARLVSCHEIFFPYVLMYCHATSDVQLYELDLVHPKTKEMINSGLIAVCHRNTRSWSPNHVAFSALKSVQPGYGEVCHWMLTDNLSWVHQDDTI